MGNVAAMPSSVTSGECSPSDSCPSCATWRIVAIHCKEIIRFANTSGHRHAYDFPSDLRAGMVDAGFHYHRRITIAKTRNSKRRATKRHRCCMSRRSATRPHPCRRQVSTSWCSPPRHQRCAGHPRPRRAHPERHTEWMNSIWQEPSTPADGEVDQWRQWIYPRANYRPGTALRDGRTQRCDCEGSTRGASRLPVAARPDRPCGAPVVQPGELVFSPSAGSAQRVVGAWGGAPVLRR